MKKYIKYALLFIAGIVVAFLFIQLTKTDNKSEASHTISYGVQRLNKLVVAEQNYANFYTHKSSTSYLGNLLSFDKNLLLKVDIKAQASYDLSQMQVEIDSVNEVIYIKEIPELKIETFPDVEFLNIEQSKLNQFSSDDLNGIKKRAIKEVGKAIDATDLKDQAHEQLIENLEEIYILARIYGWKVVDNTPYATELERRVLLW